MILGLSVPAFTILHVIISLVAIATGIVVAIALAGGKKLAGWTGVFLWTTVLTSVTGFFFHSAAFGPPHIIGVISLVILAPTMAGLYLFHLAGGWRGMYVIGSIVALWFNVVVLIIQSFQKISFLTPLAPTQSSEPAFVGSQLVAMVLLALAGYKAMRHFHPAAPLSGHRASATI